MIAYVTSYVGGVLALLPISVCLCYACQKYFAFHPGFQPDPLYWSVCPRLQTPMVRLAQVCFWLNVRSHWWYSLALNLCKQPSCTSCSSAIPCSLRCEIATYLLGSVFINNNLPFLVISTLYLAQISSSLSTGKRPFADFVISAWYSYFKHRFSQIYFPVVPVNPCIVN